MAVLSSTSILAATKTRLLVLASLALTWWLAHLAPQYRPIVQAGVSSRLQEARRKMPNIGFDWRPADDARAQHNASKLALLIEPRPMPHLVPLITHMAAVVPPDWRFLFIGSQWSVYSVGRAPAIKHQQAMGRMDVRKLPSPWSIERQEDIFRLLTDLRVYDEFLPGVEWILKFEHDSILCANSPKSLDEWLDWSWAGAPWYVDNLTRDPEGEYDQFSGTGGLSLRRVSAIRRVLGFQERHNNSEPEDEWFGKRLSVMPGEKVTSKFQGALAVENVFMEKPMGYHIHGGGSNLNHDVWKNPEMRKSIFEYCPELSMLMDMKLERERCPDDDRQGGRGADDDLPRLAVQVVGKQGEGGGTIVLQPPQPPPMPQQRGDIEH
ncbi:Uncharacterized protein TPAR_00176 [Tolypocladium paradoxum]|uniref:DUF5672 domain-containing protein n=1 Tax=Tolypocladium paradoxum TaxID=94208 RepID=A0A2S4LB13_9HYPO|nr:Uncharacterized protein TPAR_00176 [Tolypocladium paradoxum]